MDIWTIIETENGNVGLILLASLYQRIVRIHDECTGYYAGTSGSLLYGGLFRFIFIFAFLSTLRKTEGGRKRGEGFGHQGRGTV